MQICKVCIYDDTVANIAFDHEGVCNYCHQVESLKSQFGTCSAKGYERFQEILGHIKNAGRGKRYDCVVGVSGGTDSSYLLMKAVEWGLRPLAVHYDNTWNTAVASNNIKRLVRKLNVDLYTYVVDNKEVDAIKLAFLKAGVVEFDADTDLALVQVLRSTAARFGIKYILEGHSFIEEGISPIGSNYLDGRYIQSICHRFGLTKLKSLPNMTFFQFLKWILIYRQHFIRPFWYVPYSKSEARSELSNKFGWEYYEGHHLENRASAFAHSCWHRLFGIDYRNLSLSAQVRKGSISREKALQIYENNSPPSDDLKKYVQIRLGLDDETYARLLSNNFRSWRDFKTYKKWFETLRPFFYLMAKADLVPWSFYIKYCFPIPYDNQRIANSKISVADDS